MNEKPKLPTGNNRGLKQAYDLRDIAAETARKLDAVPANTIREQYQKASALRALAFMWETASERIRILRNRPLPGSLRPKEKARKPAAISALWTEDPKESLSDPGPSPQGGVG